MNIRLVTIQPQHAKGLEQLQIDCFPTLGHDELMREEHFLSHYQIFPEGDFVLLEGERVIGLGSGFLTRFDFEHYQHRFRDINANGHYTNHDPEGDWYYGGDISVHPDYRGRGLGRMLYEARKGLVKRLDLKGIIAGGVIPDFARHKHLMSVQVYVDNVVSGKLFDRTLSFQLKNGFEVRSLIENYLEDSASDNWSTLIVWDNPDYQP